MAEDSELRAYQQEGRIYVIRDVFEVVEDGKRKHLRCEYATMPHISMSDHSIVWRPCIEGVLFADIEPLGGEY